MALLKSQSHTCAICATANSGTKLGRLVVDHCHASGRVRGLLCSNCNRGLGMFRDSTASLATAIAYLTEENP